MDALPVSLLCVCNIETFDHDRTGVPVFNVMDHRPNAPSDLQSFPLSLLLSEPSVGLSASVPSLHDSLVQWVCPTGGSHHLIRTLVPLGFRRIGLWPHPKKQSLVLCFLLESIARVRVEGSRRHWKWLRSFRIIFFWGDSRLTLLMLGTRVTFEMEPGIESCGLGWNRGEQAGEGAPRIFTSPTVTLYFFLFPEASVVLGIPVGANKLFLSLKSREERPALCLIPIP